MPTFLAVIVASLAGWIVQQALAGKGFLSLGLLLGFLIWVVVFYLTRRFLSGLRPGG